MQLKAKIYLSDVIGRHGVAGEAPGGDHHIIALLPEPSGPDTIHLPPDVVPDGLEIEIYLNYCSRKCWIMIGYL